MRPSRSIDSPPGAGVGVGVGAGAGVGAGVGGGVGEGAGIGTRPAWSMTYAWSPIVACPVRATPLFAATDIRTVALDEPFWPATTAIHAALLTADHEQPESVVTSTVASPPSAGRESRVRLRLKRHGAAA